MNPTLARAYQLLDQSQRIVDELPAGQTAHLEQHAAAARHALESYGIDLDDRDQQEAVLAVIDLLVRTTPYGAPVMASMVADLQQALVSHTRPAPSIDRSST